MIRRALPILLLLACVPTVEDAADTADAPAQCEPFAPSVIDVQAEPNGLYWHAGQQRLYIADDDTNRILVRDGEVAGVFAEIPNPANDPGADGLGDLDLAADGTLYVPRFGFGIPGLGAIFAVAPDGTATAIPGVDAEWRRVGLDFDDARGLLYVATFSKDSEGMFTGWVATVDPATGVETRLVEGLSKPVGIAVVGDDLFVGDQHQQILYRVDLTARSPALEIVTDELANIDLIEATPDGDLLVLAYDAATRRGRVYRVARGGAYTIAAEGDWEPRGIAFDGVGRIFVAARDSQTIVVVPAC